MSFILLRDEQTRSTCAAANHCYFREIGHHYEIHLLRQTERVRKEDANVRFGQDQVHTSPCKCPPDGAVCSRGIFRHVLCVRFKSRGIAYYIHEPNEARINATVADYLIVSAHLQSSISLRRVKFCTGEEETWFSLMVKMIGGRPVHESSPLHEPVLGESSLGFKAANDESSGRIMRWSKQQAP